MPALTNTLSEKTSVSRLSPIRTSIAVDGTQRYIDMGATAWNRIACVVEALTDDERDTLMSFLETNETNEIDVVINSVTYRGRIIPNAAPKWSRNGSLNTVSWSLHARAI